MVSHSEVEQMVAVLAAQDKRLRVLEVRLQKEQQDKANLEVDFQHLLDQIHMIGDAAVVIG